MAVPQLPKPVPLARLSPSRYADLRLCRARLAWRVSGAGGELPQHPAVPLGRCFHAVIEAAQTGALPRMDTLPAAKRLFDETATAFWREAHPLLRVKFTRPEKLPYYQLRRAAAARWAGQLTRKTSPAGARPAAGAGRLVERMLYSRDGQLHGQPDALDITGGLVIDFKTRLAAPEDQPAISDDEARQLRLYAYLAREHGFTVSRGVIVLAQGQQLTLELPEAEAAREADAARVALSEYNAAVRAGATFADLATPAPEHCRYCPALVSCPAFWRVAQTDWQTAAGVQAQGQVMEMQANQQVITMRWIDISGTVPHDALVLVEQIPVTWFLGGTAIEVKPGTRLRLLRARIVSDDTGHTRLRPAPADTEIWLID